MERLKMRRQEVPARPRAIIAPDPAHPAVLELRAEDGTVLCALAFSRASEASRRAAIARLCAEATARDYLITPPEPLLA